MQATIGQKYIYRNNNQVFILTEKLGLTCCFETLDGNYSVGCPEAAMPVFFKSYKEKERVSHPLTKIFK